MRTRDNNFVKFMRRVDPQNSIQPSKVTSWKAPWPGRANKNDFEWLVYRIVEDYSIGMVLRGDDAFLVDTAIEWCTTEIENELARLYSGGRLNEETYEYFESWRQRFEDGEEFEGERFTF